MLWTIKANKYLKKYWNIDELKDKQIEVINELLLGHDVIGLLPTGYGKSMCYIIPPLITKKIMFIISPLISLMNEQKDKLLNLNIPCSALHSNNNNKDKEINQIINNEIKIVFMSPEYLINGDGLDLAKKLINDNKLGFLAVDESHCISVWGQDFRPEYTNIYKFRQNFSEIPIIAVTATATKSVCVDINKLLHLNDPIIVKTSFDRPNLFIDIKEISTVSVFKNKKNKESPIAKECITYIKKYNNDKIIIYVNSRKNTEDLSFELNKINHCCEAYHAGLSKEIKENIQNKFMNGEIKVIICTIAFGMGIDQIVKCVLIFGSPSSIEEYYQQIGRGGRDGLSCETVLYFDYIKFKTSLFMLKEFNDCPDLYKVKKDNLNKVKKLVDLTTCRRKYILEYFNEICDFTNCGKCDNCCRKPIIEQLEIRTDKNDFDDIFEKFDKYILF
jgi:ATP-dependent DNA helicase RecQ